MYELEIACAVGNVKVIFYLLKNGIGYLEHGYKGACVGGHLSIMKLLELRDNRRLRSWTSVWRRMLEYACRGGHMQVIEYLLDNCTGFVSWEDGFVGACYGGHLDIVRLMIEKATEAAKQLPVNFIADLYYACMGGNMQIMEFVHDSCNNKELDLHSYSHGASLYGHIDVLHYFYKKFEKSMDFDGSTEYPKNINKYIGRVLSCPRLEPV